MCPFCMTTAAVVAASATGAGVLGLVAVKVRTLLRNGNGLESRSTTTRETLKGD